MVPHPPIILPEVGKGEERKISATAGAYDRAADLIRELGPETIVVISPHSAMYYDYFHISPGDAAEGDMGRFGAPDVRMRAEYDRKFVNELSDLAEKNGFPAGTLGERDGELDHGTMVPLFYVNRHYREYRLVRIGLSGLPLADHYRLGQLIRETSEQLGRRIVVIGSGDLSHRLLKEGPYGFAEEGPEYDSRIMDVMGRAAFDELLDFDGDFCSRAAECGHRSFCVMAGALDGKTVKTERLSHEGTFGVGYGVCTYRVTGDDMERKMLDKWKTRQKREQGPKPLDDDPFVRLARYAVTVQINEGVKPELPEGLPDEMLNRRAGVFVSIHRSGQLRGCIGTILPTRRCIAEEIMENAVSAATRDPRFPAVRAYELDSLEISVDELSAPERIRSVSELDVRRYGVIVSKGLRKGLLLPNLEGVDTAEEQVSIAMRKAGIPDQEDGVLMERFEVVRHV